MIVTNSPAQQIDTITSDSTLSKHHNQQLSDYMYHEKKDKSAHFIDDLENVYNSLHTCCLNIS